MRHEVVIGAAFWFLVSAFVAFSAGRAHGDGLRDARRGSASAPQASASPEVERLDPPQAGAPREVRSSLDSSAVNSVDEAWQQFHGKVLFSDILFAPPTEFPSPGARAASLRRNGRDAVESSGGFWRLHCLAFLDPAPKAKAKAKALLVRATDVTTPANRRDVRVFHATVPPNQKVLVLDDLVLTDTIGFERGHRYEISIEGGDDEPGEAPAGKRDVYAKGVVTLM